METFMIMVMDVFKKKIKSNKQKILVRFLICIVFFLFGLSMTAEGGFFILSLINEYIGGYPLITVGLLQVIVVPWIYGTDRLINDIESMVGPKPKWFWTLATVSWKFICPLMLGIILILTIAFPGEQLAVNKIVLPRWANAIGWVIVAFPLSLIVGFAAYQYYLNKHDWVSHKKVLSKILFLRWAYFKAKIISTESKILR